ncbi:ABC transporter ATP-binding protein [Paraburkholderia sp. LEh10]|uniref:ABC transporter ATP-binding protein n=1 Tax=Paraburkholderia sp. LEh10 TaxID=2821353 RepID=UPI001AEB4D6E|nr:ABC transporter ATP-binding protein [Paraburkholderia sp. LEh10]MBP0592273.1 ABC transporter ATP-binding protein [Paraburkholderia sp. LEh10]
MNTQSSPASCARCGPFFSASGIVAGYGQSQVLQGASLRIEAGETVGLLGRNGSGRSTFLKAVMKLLPSQGAISLNGMPLERAKTHEVSRAGIGYVPEDRAIFPDLTVRENLSVGLPQSGRTKASAPLRSQPWTEEEFFELFPNLKRRANVAGGALSGGEQQMLTICRALMGQPSLLLVDEPTEGLSLSMVDQVAELLKEVARRGVAVLLVEQKLTIALGLCDRINVMGHGRIVFDGSVEEFGDSPGVRAEWLEV